MTKTTATIKDFAQTMYRILKSDRDVTMGVGGFTGAGKSTFSSKLARAYATISGTHWGFDRMTWSRKEMLQWIDGKGEKKEGQIEEYSCIVPDELFKMFYRRTWFDEEQIDAIATLNMCRDRHLLIIGNIPTFWELDGGFQSRVRFYAYIPRRGVAWIFEQENNPFSSDPWNVKDNKKIFRKKKGPYTCPNFVCEILYDDFDKEEKKKYLEIRNTKRVSAINENKPEKKVRYKNIKDQRDKLINMLCNSNDELTNKDVGEAIGMTKAAIGLIRNGLR